MEAVSQQPVSVAIEADQTAFQLYKGGILTQECGKGQTISGNGMVVNMFPIFAYSGLVVEIPKSFIVAPLSTST